MYKYQNINIGSFTNNNDEISKGKEKVTMDKKEFVDEHKHLVKVLKSPSKEDDKKEADDQEKELDEQIKKAKENKKVAKVMGCYDKGELKSSSGEKVKDKKQALAIAMSEAGLSKAEMDDLIKGGEGSKGGKVIGHTKSGKPIYEKHEQKHTQNYNSEDHSDAVNAHQLAAKKYNEELKKHVKNAENTLAPTEFDEHINRAKESKQKQLHHSSMAELHYNAMNSKLDKNKDKKEIKKSFDMDISNKTISNTDLIKSHIGYQFTNAENLKVSKKGSEIKEKLKAIKDKELVEISAFQSKMEALKAVIPTAPTEPVNNYDEVELPEKLTTYPWNETYCNEEKSSNNMVISATETKPEKSEAQILCDNKREYNRNVDKIVECQKEIILINTMLNNFSDSKTYDLSVKQATVLGF